MRMAADGQSQSTTSPTASASAPSPVTIVQEPPSPHAPSSTSSLMPVHPADGDASKVTRSPIIRVRSVRAASGGTAASANGASDESGVPKRPPLPTRKVEPAAADEPREQTGAKAVEEPSAAALPPARPTRHEGNGRVAPPAAAPPKTAPPLAAPSAWAAAAQPKPQQLVPSQVLLGANPAASLPAGRRAHTAAATLTAPSLLSTRITPVTAAAPTGPPAAPAAPAAPSATRPVLPGVCSDSSWQPDYARSLLSKAPTSAPALVPVAVPTPLATARTAATARLVARGAAVRPAAESESSGDWSSDSADGARAIEEDHGSRGSDSSASETESCAKPADGDGAEVDSRSSADLGGSRPTTSQICAADYSRDVVCPACTYRNPVSLRECALCERSLPSVCEVLPFTLKKKRASAAGKPPNATSKADPAAPTAKPASTGGTSAPDSTGSRKDGTPPKKDKGKAKERAKEAAKEGETEKATSLASLSRSPCSVTATPPSLPALAETLDETLDETLEQKARPLRSNEARAHTRQASVSPPTATTIEVAGKAADDARAEATQPGDLTGRISAGSPVDPTPGDEVLGRTSEPAAAAAAEEPAAEGAGGGGGSAIDPTSRVIRNLRKKLKQVAELERRGEDELTPEEEGKVRQKEALEHALRALLEACGGDPAAAAACTPPPPPAAASSAAALPRPAKPPAEGCAGGSAKGKGTAPERPARSPSKPGARGGHLAGPSPRLTAGQSANPWAALSNTEADSEDEDEDEDEDEEGAAAAAAEVKTGDAEPEVAEEAEAASLPHTRADAEWQPAVSFAKQMGARPVHLLVERMAVASAPIKSPVHVCPSDLVRRHELEAARGAEGSCVSTGYARGSWRMRKPNL